MNRRQSIHINTLHAQGGKGKFVPVLN